MKNIITFMCLYEFQFIMKRQGVRIFLLGRTHYCKSLFRHFLHQVSHALHCVSFVSMLWVCGKHANQTMSIHDSSTDEVAVLVDAGSDVVLNNLLQIRFGPWSDISPTLSEKFESFVFIQCFQNNAIFVLPVKKRVA